MNFSESISLTARCPRLVFLAILLTCSINSKAFQWSSVVSNNIYTLNTGNVGIGSTAPLYKLEVVSTNNAKLLVKSTASPNPAVIEAAAASGTAVIEAVSSPSALIRIGSRSNHDLSLITNNTEKLVVKSDGKVGIGKAPAYALDVNGTVNASSISMGGQMLVSSQWINSGSNINFSTGMVLIGTNKTPLGYKLAVGGKIISEEVVVRMQANWPDYVFREDYKLPPLSEIERFITLNKHLPDFPDEQSVANNGVSLGELNTALVKKVEELTLYLIEQEKRIAHLEKLLVQK